VENIKKAIDELQLKLKDLNRKIINDENMKTLDYKKEIENNLQKRKNDLERLEKSKPKEVKKPTKKQNKEYEIKLKTLNEQLEKIYNDISKNESNLKELKDKISSISNIEYNFNDIKTKVDEMNDTVKIYASKLELESSDLEIKIDIPKDIINNKKIYLNKEIKVVESKLCEDIDESLISKKNQLLKEKDKLIAETDSEEKEYQKYLADLENWKINKLEIIGDISKENTIESLENDLNYINNNLDNDYKDHKDERINLVEQIYLKKKEIVEVYENIYLPVNNEIERILNKVDNQINFKTNMIITDKKFDERILNYISKNYAGIFSGKTDSLNKMNNMINSKDFNNLEDIKIFIDDVLECIYEDIDNSSKKIKNKEDFYQLLCGLDYIDVTYTLKVGDSSIQELSPGERGIVLLIFYLALNQNDIPIIIDQPEDNLDNQSVYDKLVPCICEAKKKRQVIIVTHNPNIAVACDAEQIIYCNMNKLKNEITYISGSIENNEIRKKVIDVLEGTMPAFDLRKMKYLN
jgi:DNA repair exonuclease SbcCD ATPase subunit